MLEYQKVKKNRLNQYGAERFGRLIFVTIRKSVGLKGLNGHVRVTCLYTVGNCLRAADSDMAAAAAAA